MKLNTNLLVFAHRLRYLGEIHLVQSGQIRTVSLEKFLAEDRPQTLVSVTRLAAEKLARRGFSESGEESLV